jgi:hypothetical protein
MSVAMIARLTGITQYKVRLLLAHNQNATSKLAGIKSKASNLQAEHLRFLTSKETLKSW